MRRARIFWRLIRRRSAVEQELDDEVRAFADEKIQRRVKSGLPPEEARRITLAEIGSIEAVKEHTRDVRPGVHVDALVKDVAFAWRHVCRRPLSTATVAAMIAVGVATTTIAFSAVNAVFFKPLAARDPAQLRMVAWTSTRREFAGTTFSQPVWDARLAAPWRA